MILNVIDIAADSNKINNFGTIHHNLVIIFNTNRTNGDTQMLLSPY